MIYTPRRPLHRRPLLPVQRQRRVQHLRRLRTGTTTIIRIRSLPNPHQYPLQDRLFHPLIRMNCNKLHNNGRTISKAMGLSTLIIRQRITMIRARKQHLHHRPLIMHLLLLNKQGQTTISHQFPL